MCLPQTSRNLKINDEVFFLKVTLFGGNDQQAGVVLFYGFVPFSLHLFYPLLPRPLLQTYCLVAPL